MNDSLLDNRGLFAALIDDGRPLLKLTGLLLILFGLFAFFLGATGHFLPHDVAFLGMSVERLRTIAESRLVHFMIHDRVSFGGTLIAVGTLYLWLAEFPLRAGQAWAWWTLLVSGVVGFSSFLAYLGYGYLDTWHGVGTLVLFPIFAGGMFRSAVALRPLPPIGVVWKSRRPIACRSAYEAGHLLLLATAACLVLGGLIIMTVGMTTVFVPQDLDYMDIQPADLDRINPRLIPLIAHDRAGFGGGVCCCGVTMVLCLLCGQPSRSLWQALLITGVAGFGSAIGVHFPIGYTDFIHLAPAYLGAAMFAGGLVLTFGRMVRSDS